MSLMDYAPRGRGSPERSRLDTPYRLSLDLLASLHKRWVAAIRSLPSAAFERTFRHPDLGIMSLNQQLALYAWHGRHHVAQIASLAAREGWA